MFALCSSLTLSHTLYATAKKYWKLRHLHPCKKRALARVCVCATIPGAQRIRLIYSAELQRQSMCRGEFAKLVLTHFHPQLVGGNWGNGAATAILSCIHERSRTMACAVLISDVRQLTAWFHGALLERFFIDIFETVLITSLHTIHNYADLRHKKGIWIFDKTFTTPLLISINKEILPINKSNFKMMKW